MKKEYSKDEILKDIDDKESDSDGPVADFFSALLAIKRSKKYKAGDDVTDAVSSLMDERKERKHEKDEEKKVNKKVKKKEEEKK